MRKCLLIWLLISSAQAEAASVTASPPRQVSVTIYRAPDRESGSIDIDELGGFALVTETREVLLVAGESRLGFEGVADGIEAASAIVTGLPSSVIEKNRDAALLSPSALIAVAVGKTVMLIRTNRKTGKTTRVPGTILSDVDGILFQTGEGIEALRCSGITEAFSFDGHEIGLSATPTLSVLTRSDQPVHTMVTLSYLAGGFDWAADYTAKLSADGTTIDLGAWVTLANSNGITFTNATAQVVAGRLNHDSGRIDPILLRSSIIARCWSRGSTGDASSDVAYMQAMPAAFMASRAAESDDIIVTAQRRVELEQLGDLKLYRVPYPTTIASRQAKQVRLLDRRTIPVTRFYTADLQANETGKLDPAKVSLRSRNDKAHHLGLPLPSGRISTFQPAGQRLLLVGESGLADTAVDEDVEIEIGDASDVQVQQTEDTRNRNGSYKIIPMVPGVAFLKMNALDDTSRIQISNAQPKPINFELRLKLDDGQKVARADHAFGMKNGRPIFRLIIPANNTVLIRYQTVSGPQDGS
jgi:hypothetical protein